MMAAMLSGLAPAAVEAQTAGMTERYAGIKAGATIEWAEDSGRGTAAAGGLMVGIPISGRWTAEIDFWLSDSLETSAGGRHGDQIAGLSFVRRLGDGRIGPHVLLGLSAATTIDELETCLARRDGAASGGPAIVSCAAPDVTDRRTDRFTNVTLFPVVGIGTSVRVSDRIRIVPEVRVDVGLTAFLVRPSLGVRVVF
jgi:hypothetical protein